jgi:hypothetical protein
MSNADRTEIKELHVFLNRDSIVEGWGDETPEIVALMAKNLRGWYPNAEVMINLGDVTQHAIAYGPNPTDLDFSARVDHEMIDQDIEAAYEFAVNHVYGAAA